MPMEVGSICKSRGVEIVGVLTDGQDNNGQERDPGGMTGDPSRR